MFYELKIKNISKNIINHITKYLLSLRKRKRKRNMKLGVTYSLFSGEEMLRGSIRSIRKHVDYVNIVYQKYSWFGDGAAKGVLDTLNQLLDEGLIDKIIEYNFYDYGNSELLSDYAIEKRNIGLRDIKKRGCTHCLIMDVDEYYIEDQFARAKEYILDHGITHSCCSIYDYSVTPICRYRDINKYSVPFIFKLKTTSRLTKRPNMPCKIDSLRSLKFNKYFDRFYYFNSIIMHHMTGIRADFDKKLTASITNSTEQGKKFVNEFRKEHIKITKLNVEDLLLKKNELGGYIIVDDTFNLTEGSKYGEFS